MEDVELSACEGFLEACEDHRFAKEKSTIRCHDDVKSNLAVAHTPRVVMTEKNSAARRVLRTMLGPQECNEV